MIDKAPQPAGALVRQVGPNESAATLADPRATVAGTQRFRQQAIAAYLRGDREARLLRAAPPWTAGVFAGCALLVSGFLALAIVGQVDVTSEGPGILRAEGDARLVRSEIAGRVDEVRVRSGDRVSAGQTLAVLASASLRASLVEADQRLAQAAAARSSFDETRSSLFERRRALLSARTEILRRRLRAERHGMAHKRARARRQNALADEGFSTRIEEDRTFEDVFDAQAAHLGTAEQLERVAADLAALGLEREGERAQVKAQLEAAEAHRAGIALAVEQTTIKAAAEGILDAVLVRRGDAIEAGAPVAKLVTGSAAQHIIAFIPERDRAFLEPGAAARIELTQLPAAEFGTLQATVSRVAQRTASVAELKDVLGDNAAADQSVYRVDLVLADGQRRAQLGPRIHPGSLVNARFVLRRRSIASIVFSPLMRLGPGSPGAS